LLLDTGGANGFDVGEHVLDPNEDGEHDDDDLIYLMVGGKPLEYTDIIFSNRWVFS